MVLENVEKESESWKTLKRKVKVLENVEKESESVRKR